MLAWQIDILDEDYKVIGKLVVEAPTMEQAIVKAKDVIDSRPKDEGQPVGGLYFRTQATLPAYFRYFTKRIK